MKKSRGILACLLTLALVASAAILAACGQSSSSQSSSSESFGSSAAEEEALPPVQLKTKPFYVLVVGNDSRTGTVEINQGPYADGKGRSDTLMMARVDPKKYQITLVSIPRDTQATYNGEVCKINDMLKYEGIEGLEKAVTDLTGVEFDHYLMCTFVSFEQLINDFGGVALDVKADQSMQDIVSGDQIEYPAGWYDHLNGAETLVFARERHAYDPNGEVYRQTNDRYVVQCLIEQILEKPETAVEVATKLYGDVETDWDQRELMAYVEDFMKNYKKVKFLSGSGPWYGDMDPDTGKWLTVRDEETWAQVMDVVNKGGDPNDVVETLSLYADVSAESDGSDGGEEAAE